MRHSLLAKDSFARFKQCLQIQYIKISVEAASADIEVTRVFTAEIKKIIEDSDFHHILFLTWMRQGCIRKSYLQELTSYGKKYWCLASGHPRTNFAPWREHITNYKTKAITGVSLNSQSNEKHSKIFVCQSFGLQTEGSLNIFSQYGVLSSFAV
jgi:hypothetical protein